MKLTRANIWNWKQNKPTQVVRDLEPYVEPWKVYEILLQRGVFKWLAVRRDIIRLKNEWKERLKMADIEFKEAKEDDAPYHTAYMKGYRQALWECRQEVRALCHSQRWQAPDNDREAQRWLEDYQNGEVAKSSSCVENS